jgi:hypothetical protein
MAGGVAFAIGFVGPALFSSSNLGPLLGIFITGPLGLLVGALVGILLSAGDSAGRTLDTEPRWLLGAWLATLLYTLGSSVVGIGLVAIGAQVSVLICAAVLFYLVPARLPQWVASNRPVFLLGGVAALLASVFPPVEQASGRATFAHFLDPRFDASTHVPEFTVDQGILLLIFVVIVSAAALAVVIGGKSR